MARRKTAAQLREAMEAAERREAAARATKAAKPLPADGSQAKSRDFKQYVYRSLWSRLAEGDHVPYLVDAVPADVAAAGTETACGITVAESIANASKLPGIRGSGVSPTRIFWYEGLTNAIYRRTRTGGVRIQYYEGRTANNAEPVRSHHSVPISITTGNISTKDITDKYDAIFKDKGKNMMGSKNGRFWMEVETATRLFQENN